jgi:hypothetical protein
MLIQHSSAPRGEGADNNGRPSNNRRPTRKSSCRYAGNRGIFANRVQIGMVGINVPIPVPMVFHSFGG